jgi:calcineurin-like phosphoesterase family protein
MKYWITTDTHFGHEKIKDFCGRPDGFEEKILRGFVDIVNSDDVFIHLGDVCWGNDSEWHRKISLSMPFVKKWLLIGNHDKKTNSWYYDHGWHFVGETILLNMFGLRILLSHRPQPDGDYDVNVHGHLHNTGHHETFNDDKHISFYIEHKYIPIDLRKIVGK